MKKFAKLSSILLGGILALSLFAFAAETEEEKTYIVYPKETVSLFSAEGESPRYMVIGEEELNMLLEEAPEMIDWYEENVEFHFSESEIDYNWTNTSALVRIKASKMHNLKYQGKGITVGIIDSGVFPHDEYKDRLLPGHNYVDKENPDDTTDTLGHGTTVAGVLASANDEVGIDSVAPLVKIVPLKVDKPDGKPDLYAVASAIWDAVDKYECDVINLSLGTTDNPRTLKEAIDHAVSEKVTVVAAVGNYAVNDNQYVVNDTEEYPAAYDNVIGVGSIDWLDYSRSPFSKKNNSVFITAPGDYIVTTDIGNKYVKSAGTSLAAPLVSGAVALLKQANSKLTPAEIMNILAESARDDSKGDGYDTAYGHGVLDVAAAIELAQGNERLAPDTVTYTVSAMNSTLNGAVSVKDYVTGYIGSYPLGASFTAKAEPTYTIDDGTEYKFAYWENGNGAHVSGDATYTFNATSNFTLRAVYDKVTVEGEKETEKKVEFWNGNGILLKTATVDGTTGTVAAGSIPEDDAKMTGYAFDCWLDEDENKFTADSILEKNLTRVVAQFTDRTAEYSLTFDDNTDTNETKTGKYGEKVSYTATGDSFDYWELGGKPISYNPTIEIALWDTDATITAVYDKDDAKKIPTVVLDTGADKANFLIYSVPTGYRIVDAGIVFGTENSTPRVASFHSKASVKNLPENGFGQFTAQPGDVSHVVARGYLIYNDGTATRVIYADK